MLSVARWQAISCLLDSGSIFSLAQGFQRGQAIWTVIHDHKDDGPDVEALGNLPSVFGSIADRFLELKALAARGQKTTVYRVPEELAFSITGFRIADAAAARMLANRIARKLPRSSTGRRLRETMTSMFRR